MESLRDVTGVRVLSRYIVELTFETGEVKVLDLKPLLDVKGYARDEVADRPR